MGRLGIEDNIAVRSIGKSYSEVCIDKEIAIEIFTLENKNGTKLLISNFGATAISLFVKDKNGILSDIILGYENQSDYFKDEFYFGSVVGRYANRIAGDAVIIDNVTYKISTTNGGYHLHGGEHGFNKKIFNVTPFCNENQVGLILKYTSSHLEEGFPGDLQLEVIYTLDDGDNWTVEYKATSSKTTILNLTQHTYFNLSGNLNTTIENHELKINSDYYLPVNEHQVPTGVFENVSNSIFDFTAFKKIGSDINTNNKQLKLSGGYDHTWVLEKKATSVIKNAASLVDYNSGIRLDVFTTEPSIHLYTGNFLENIIGKNGLVYGKRSGLCLETQHFPDSPNNPHFPTTILKAGEEFYSKTIFKFSIDTA
jgi:aldose 1-epimerase